MWAGEGQPVWNRHGGMEWLGVEINIMFSCLMLFAKRNEKLDSGSTEEKRKDVISRSRVHYVVGGMSGF